MRVVTPLRFVSGVIGLWITARVAILLPGIAAEDATAVAPARAGAYHASNRALASAPEGNGLAEFARISGEEHLPRPASVARRPDAQSSAVANPTLPASAGQKVAVAPAAIGIVANLADNAALAALAASAPAVSLSPAGLLAAPTPLSPAPVAQNPSRWSGNFYLFRRGDGGTAALATGGQLGGSQAGARVAYRLNPTGPARLALAARVSTPLGDRHGAEAAAGIDWHPLPTAPLRVSIERRVDLGGAGRNAWSAYAAGGFWREYGGHIVVDGYAQAGVVGARRRDLFADGALRAGRRADLGGSRSLMIGAGAWAAAQPRVDRLDLGPRVALGLPVGGSAITAAAEWRIRVAGDAAPRSGLALTLAADF